MFVITFLTVLFDQHDDFNPAWQVSEIIYRRVENREILARVTMFDQGPIVSNATTTGNGTGAISFGDETSWDLENDDKVHNKTLTNNNSTALLSPLESDTVTATIQYTATPIGIRTTLLLFMTALRRKIWSHDARDDAAIAYHRGLFWQFHDPVSNVKMTVTLDLRVIAGNYVTVGELELGLRILVRELSVFSMLGFVGTMRKVGGARDFAVVRTFVPATGEEGGGGLRGVGTVV